MKKLAPGEQLKDRLNQPHVTRIEALKQFQGTTPLTPQALKELQESENAAKRLFLLRQKRGNPARGRKLLAEIRQWIKSSRQA